MIRFGTKQSLLIKNISFARNMSFLSSPQVTHFDVFEIEKKSNLLHLEYVQVNSFFNNVELETVSSVLSTSQQAIKAAGKM